MLYELYPRIFINPKAITLLRSGAKPSGEGYSLEAYHKLRRSGKQVTTVIIHIEGKEYEKEMESRQASFDLIHKLRKLANEEDNAK